MLTLLLLDDIVRIIAFCALLHPRRERTSPSLLLRKGVYICLISLLSQHSNTGSSLVTFARRAEMVSPFICDI